MLSELTLDRAITSDLSRARETAEIVIGNRPIPLTVDPAWREMRFGTWEGLTWNEIVARYPEVDPNVGKVPKYHTPEGGETFDDVCSRVRAAVDSIASQARTGERILVATHAGALHALLRVVLGEDEATALAVRFEPGTLTHIAFGPRGASLVDLNRSPAAAQTAAGGTRERE